MLKKLSLALILLSTKAISFGQLSREDYQVYAAIIKTEIQDSTRSIAIIKYGMDSTEKNENTLNRAGQLASENLSERYEVYFWTENNKKERPSTIDSTSAQLLIDYCKSKVDKFIFANNFNQTYKTVLIEKFPIRQKSIQQDWKAFYEKYPNSAGIFSFSKIKYYTGGATGVVYYWVRRNGLNGHGALAVMTKINGEWQMKYKIYLWLN